MPPLSTRREPFESVTTLAVTPLGVVPVFLALIALASPLSVLLLESTVMLNVPDAVVSARLPVPTEVGSVI